jgi:hypothetical protein
MPPLLAVGDAADTFCSGAMVGTSSDMSRNAATRKIPGP